MTTDVVVKPALANAETPAASPSSVAVSSPVGAEPLLRIGEGGKLEARLDVVERVFMSGHQDDPVNLVTVFGPSRQGKSTLMNLLAGDSSFGVGNDMDPMTKGVDISPSLVPLRTFSRAAAAAGGSGDGSVTNGDAPVAESETQAKRGWFGSSKRPAEDRIVMGFADVEGQGDRDERYDMKIFCPMMLFSKVVVLNWKGAVEKHRLLEILRRTVRLASECVEEDLSRPEQRGHLHIVFRDWAFKDDVNLVRGILFDEEAPDCADSKRRNETRATIQKAFSSISVWLLPAPVVGVEGAEELHNIHLKLQSLSRLFTLKLDALRRTIAAQLCGPAAFSGKRLTGRSIGRLLPHIVHRLNADGVLRLHTLHRSMVDDEVWELVRKTARQLQTEMVPLIEDDERLISKATFGREWRRIADEYWPKLVERVEDLQGEEESQKRSRRLWDSVWEGWSSSRTPELSRRLLARSKLALAAAEQRFQEQAAARVTGCMPMSADRLEVALRYTRGDALEEFRRRCVFDSTTELADQEKVVNALADKASAEARVTNSKAIEERATELQATTREEMRRSVLATISEWRRSPPLDHLDFDAWWASTWQTLLVGPRGKLSELGLGEPNWFTVDFDARWAGAEMSRAAVRKDVASIRQAHASLAAASKQGEPSPIMSALRAAEEAQLAVEVVQPVRERLAELMRVQSCMANADHPESLSSAIREAISAGLQGHALTAASKRLNEAVAIMLEKQSCDAQTALMPLAAEGDALVSRSALGEKALAGKNAVMARMQPVVDGILPLDVVEKLRQGVCDSWSTWLDFVKHQHDVSLQLHVSAVRNKIARKLQKETMAHAAGGKIPSAEELELAWGERKAAALAMFREECIHDHVDELAQGESQLSAHIHEHLTAAQAKADGRRCEEALVDAIRREDEEALRSSIFAARAAGADSSTIGRGETAMKKLIATKELVAAVAGEDSDSLLAAIGGALEAGVPPHKVAAAEARHKVLIASAALTEACLRDGEAALQEALAVARQVGVDAAVLNKARAQHRKLVATRELRVATKRADIDSLKSCLAAAQEAGTETELAKAAQEQLSKLVAARAVTDSIRTEDTSAIKQAVEAARTNGVDAAIIAEGERRLQHVEVKSRLIEASNGEDEDSIRASIAAAREIGVDAATLTRGETALRRAICAKDLAVAHAGEHVENLQAAIHAAKEVGVLQEKVGASELRHKVLVSTAALKEACACRDAAVVRKALATAREVGVAVELVDTAVLHLAKLVAARELQTAMGSEDIVALRRALYEGTEAGLESAELQLADARLQRLITTRELADAAAAGECNRLQRALGDAEAAGVQASLIEAAQARLRALLAMKAVTDAVDREDEASLNRALSSARDVGVNPEMLATGQKKLRDLVAQRNLEEGIQGGDEKHLLQSIEAARGASVSVELMAKAELTSHRLAMTRELRDAMRSSHESDLARSIEAAAESGVDTTVVELAQKLLGQLVASKSLVEATQGDNEAALQSAVENSRNAGVDSDLVSKGQERLRFLVAVRRLEEALEDGDDAYMEAVDNARGVGVDVHMLASSDTKRQRFVCLKAVTEAVAAEDEAALQRALAHAKSAGIEDSALAVGHSKHQALAAHRHLAEAVEIGDETMLVKAIKVAKCADAKVESIDAAEKTHRKIVAAKQLSDAMRDGQEIELRRTLTAARQAGVEEARCDVAEKQLHKVVAARLLSEAVQRGDEDTLGSAIEAASTAGVEQNSLDSAQRQLRALVAERELISAASGENKEAFDMALSDARKAGVSTQRIATAEAKHRRRIASADLADALRSNEVVPLQTAVAAARVAGIDRSTLEAAEEGLRRLVAKLALQDATDAGDEAAMRRATQQARDAGVDSAAVGVTETALRLLVATRSLATAAESLDASALEAALKEAREAGVDVGPLHFAEGALRKLHVVRELRDAAGTLNSEAGVERLRRTIVEANEIGVEAASVTAAEAQLWQAEAQAELVAAIDSSSEEAIQQAFAAAQAINLQDTDLLAAASLQLRHLPLKRAIADAVQDTDVQGLRLAIEKAVSEKLPQDAVHAAGQELEKLLLVRGLTEATIVGDEAALSSAINNAVEANVEDGAIAPARSRLRELVAERKLRVALAIEDPMKSAAVRRSLIEAKQAGVDAALVSVVESRLKELTARQSITKAERLNISVAAREKASHNLFWSTAVPDDGRQSVGPPSSLQWNVRILGELNLDLEVSVLLRTGNDDETTVEILEKEARGEHFVGKYQPKRNKRQLAASGDNCDDQVDPRNTVEAVRFQFSNAFSWFTAKDVEIVTVFEWPLPKLPPLTPLALPQQRQVPWAPPVVLASQRQDEHPLTLPSFPTVLESALVPLNEEDRGSSASGPFRNDGRRDDGWTDQALANLPGGPTAIKPKGTGPEVFVICGQDSDSCYDHAESEREEAILDSANANGYESQIQLYDRDSGVAMQAAPSARRRPRSRGALLGMVSWMSCVCEAQPSRQNGGATIRASASAVGRQASVPAPGAADTVVSRLPRSTSRR